MAEIPAAAWTRRLDKGYPEASHPTRPGLRRLLDLLPTLWRIRRYTVQQRRAGREPWSDFFNRLDPAPEMGVPLGGLGGGTITRGWRGGFVRWAIAPGMPAYQTAPASQFAVRIQREGEPPKSTTLAAEPPGGGFLDGWTFGFPQGEATDHALYPRAWTVYEGLAPGITLTCRQVLPILPNNYQEASTPAAVFVWEIANSSQLEANVSVLFSFQNGMGGDTDSSGGHRNQPFREEGPGASVKGVRLEHRWRRKLGGRTYEDPLAFAIAAREEDGVTVTARPRFEVRKGARVIWGDFSPDGTLTASVDARPSEKGEIIGAALAAAVTVPPCETREVAFSLAWDAPIARFASGRGWYRRYTRFYGREGDAAGRIARDALADYPTWEAQIEAWQEDVLYDAQLPQWYQGALFNELYIAAAGGTIWTDGMVKDEGTPESTNPVTPEPPGGLGHFAILEGHEYRLYNTYDVHFYASFALAQLWPELELSLQRDFARALRAEDRTRVPLLFTSGDAPRKVHGAIPHDLGSPDGDPWVVLNAYNGQDTGRWKDLNSKFALQVYRDFVATQDIDFLAEMWPAVKASLEYLAQFDRDSDGLIENDPFPDQTYDTWAAEGPTAYSGGLWLAALQAAAEIAALLDAPDEARGYRERLVRGQAAYEKALWTGKVYRFAAKGANADVIMADQLAGDWYARACGLPGIVPSEHARRALERIYEANVGGVAEGNMGAVNGVLPDGSIDESDLQSEEMWTGVGYALGAAMIQLGMASEGFSVAKGVYTTGYDRFGTGFMTPEAWTADGGHRAIGYLRPLAIWAMQWAWQRRGEDGG